MKKNILLFILLPLLSFSQTQIGADIDGEAAGDQSGNSVSLSSDGSVLAIGASQHDPVGHVRVYTNTSGSWVQIGADIDGVFSNELWGHTVSLSSDGSVLAISSIRNAQSGTNSGLVRVYRNIAANWIQIGATIFGEIALDQSGTSVSLSSDGTVVAIGAPLNDGNGSTSGHVRVYRNTSGNWVQIGTDIDGEAAGDRSGRSVSLSSDGSMVAIGAYKNDGNGLNSGHVRVYTNTSGNWVQMGADIDGETAEDEFGYSVSLSSDGSVVAIGAILNDGNGSDSGHVRVYRNTSGGWVQISADIDGEAAEDQFGYSVSLSSDGSVVAIGAILNDGSGSDSGHVRVYSNTSGSWIQIGTDIDGEAAQDLSGWFVSLSSDGSVVAIGALSNGGNGEQSGHVRVYNLSEVLSLNAFVNSQFSLYPNPTKNQFTIQLENSTELKSVNIYNKIGQLVLKSKETTINTSKLASGLYIVAIETNKGKGFKKLILE